MSLTYLVGDLYLYGMERWKAFFEYSSISSEILALYMEIRMVLKELGHTEESIKRIDSAPNELWNLKRKMSEKIERLFESISSYGFDITRGQFNDYLQTKLNNIDLLIPLNDGGEKRNDRWDEDN